MKPTRMARVICLALFLVGTFGSQRAFAQSFVFPGDNFDTVCAGTVSTFTVSRPVSFPADLTATGTFSVKYVLLGDPSLAGKSVRIVETANHLCDLSIDRRVPCQLLKLRKQGDLYQVCDFRMSREPYEVTTAPMHIPADASLAEKLQLIYLQTAKSSPGLAHVSLDRFGSEGASLNSPYYDLMSELHYFGPGHPAEGHALLWRLQLGDSTVLPRLYKLAEQYPVFLDLLPSALKTYGHDAVTTLCLIAEGRLLPAGAEGKLPAGKESALIVLREMTPPPPEALPLMIKLLDDPNERFRYFAYSTAVLIRYTDAHKPGYPLGENEKALIDEMKAWWDTEGKRKFRYVLQAQ